MTALENMQQAGYLEGIKTDFQLRGAITRAEAVAIIDNLIALFIPEMGYYGGLDGERLMVEGNVVINANAVSLANTEVNGNVYLMNGIGDYFTQVDLRNVVVTDTLYLDGVRLGKAELYNTLVYHARNNGVDNKVNLSGNSHIEYATLHQSASIGGERYKRSGPGVQNLIVTADFSFAGGNYDYVRLGVDIGYLENNAAGLSFHAGGVTIQQLHLNADTSISAETKVITQTGTGKLTTNDW